MKIAVIGLGLLGGSFAKALSQKHEVRGLDLDQSVVSAAIAEGAITGLSDGKFIGECDFCLVCLPPSACAEYIIENIGAMKRGAIIADVCGVKRDIMREAKAAVCRAEADYVGIHPMAGKEKGGYQNSDAAMFKDRNFVIITDGVVDDALKKTEALALECGFGKIVRCDADAHDKAIAYTSQLAHAVSNCYMRSRGALKTDGFTGGSFEDLTRVGIMDEKMWADLFFKNADELCPLIDTTAQLLSEISRLVREGDGEALIEKLADARKFGKNKTL